jgi:hypothetical protein
MEFCGMFHFHYAFDDESVTSACDRVTKKLAHIVEKHSDRQTTNDKPRADWARLCVVT